MLIKFNSKLFTTHFVISVILSISALIHVQGYTMNRASLLSLTQLHVQGFTMNRASLLSLTQLHVQGFTMNRAFLLSLTQLHSMLHLNQ